MFKMMLAEVALQRGQPQVAVPAYLELARETRDPRIAQRATEIAWNARFVSAALEAAGIWLQADPGVDAGAPGPRHAARQPGSSSATRCRTSSSWLAADKDNVGQSFLQLITLLARHKDKQAVLKLMQALAQAVPDGAGGAARASRRPRGTRTTSDLSLAEARAALKLRPDWELAALFVAQVLQRRSNDEAVALSRRVSRALSEGAATRG